ncbi:MAG: hypothetical protein WC175_05260 [Candidatus Dojkabacteria bacterium]
MKTTRPGLAQMLDPDKWDWVELTNLQKVLLPLYGVIGAVCFTVLLTLACLVLG